MRVVVAFNGPATAAERVVLARRDIPLFAEVAAQGVTPTVALFTDVGGYAPALTAAGVDVRVLPVSLPPRVGSLVRLPRATRRLRTLLADVRPDALEATEPMPALAAGLAGRRRCATCYRRQHQHGRWPLLAASRLAATLCGHTIVSNPAMREVAVRADGTPVERVLIASTGSPEPRTPAPHEVTALRAGIGVADGAVLVVAISWLRDEKGLDVLLDAADEVTRTVPVHVAIVGSGPAGSSLNAHAARLRAPVHFAGHVDDVAPWYAVADVIAMPSRRESLGRTTLEAMAAARPIVASRVGGLAVALDDGQSALLVPPGDAPALAAALRRVATDRALAAHLAAGARAAFEARYTIRHMAAARIAAWRHASEAFR